MEYLIFGSIAVILIFLFVQYFNKLKSKGDIEQIRLTWGKSKSKQSYNFNVIRKYAEVVKAKFHRLTDQTIDDIDFNRLFTFVDRTTSKVGQQYLYKKIIEPSDSTEDSSEPFISLFSQDSHLREAVQVELLKLNNADAYYISSLIGGIAIEKPRWAKYLMPYVILITGLIVLSFKFHFLLIVLIFPMVLNMFIHIANRENTLQFTLSIPQLNILINVSKELLKRGGLLHDEAVQTSISDLKSFQQHSRLIRFRSTGFDSDLTQYFFDIVKVIFLIEVLSIFKMVKQLKDKRAAIITIFDYVGKIDASISVASLRADKLKTCRPAFLHAKKEVVAKNIYHPLIKNCVKNSLTINNRSILITGSNMSGKSTFLRTLAINSILAQTIYTCFAEEFITPVLKQFSSIRIDDNLFEGKSYYFQEVNIMGTLIAEADQPSQSLLILDEIFKGTNTVERISAAKAILSYLNSGDNIVVVSTHDIELSEMLDGEYDLYHFTETIENNELQFDHKIKSGQLMTRNAIRLLELSNYPDKIISEARQISMTLRTAKIMRDR